MRMTDPFIAELIWEGETTRRVLERVPEDKLSWRPHDKSMSLGQLALHIAQVPAAIAFLLKEPIFEGVPPPAGEPASRAEVLEVLEASISHAKTTLTAWTDDDMAAPWAFVRSGRTLLSGPRVGMVRSLMFNHWYHHRGQLTVYLRLLGVPVPSVYGPSADENPFP